MEIRKCESITNHYVGEVANLDPEKFRNISKPYEGNSDQEFLDYIHKLGWEIENILDELDEETKEEGYKLVGAPEKIVWSSIQKGEIVWYESGKKVEGQTRNDGFETELTTDESW
jgi:hypothetical protein